MTTTRDRVLREIDSSRKSITAFLTRIVRAKSVTGDEQPAQELVRDKLKALGAAVDYWKPKASDFKGFEKFTDGEKPFDRRPNVVARFRGSGSKRTLAFNGHIDVVPTGERSLWKHDPFGAEILKGVLYGRGACDMKGGLVAAIFAIQSIRDAGVDLENDLLLESVIGEESGGVGTLASILRGHVPNAAIIAEPTNFELLTSQVGCLMFRLKVTGKAAHGASRYMGVSAVEKFQPVMNRLLELERRRSKMVRSPLYSRVPNAVTLSIGTVRAGNWDSTVPDELVAEGRYGVWPGERLDHARMQFERAVEEVARRDRWLRNHKPEVSWFGPQWESAEIAHDHWLAGMVEAASEEVFGRKPVRGGMTGGTDMRLFTNLAKVPALIYGPGDDSTAHFSDERVRVEDVIRACKVYALTAIAWG